MRASALLHLTPQTISGQIGALEDFFGEQLFSRTGRGLILTETGRLVYDYADELFSVGRELLDTLKGRPAGRPMRFVVGIADVVPKLIAYRLLAPALRLPESIRLICREGSWDTLLAELAVHRLDMVLADAPAPLP